MSSQSNPMANPLVYPHMIRELDGHEVTQTLDEFRAILPPERTPLEKFIRKILIIYPPTTDANTITQLNDWGVPIYESGLSVLDDGLQLDMSDIVKYTEAFFSGMSVSSYDYNLSFRNPVPQDDGQGVYYNLDLFRGESNLGPVRFIKA